jgi:hypothetical protein
MVVKVFYFMALKTSTQLRKRINKMISKNLSKIPLLPVLLLPPQI